MTSAADLLRRFRSDFAFYAPRALRIRTKDGSVEPFVLNPAQLAIHAALEKQKRETGRVRAIVLKGRQQGASTYIGGRFYWLTSGEFGKRAYILTHEQAATDNLFAMTKRFHEHCPGELRPSTAGDNARELLFDVLDSGYKVATAGAKATGRSGTAQYFHGSEVAFWPNAADHMAGIGQVVPNAPGTEVVLETTANGVGNLFHAMWLRASRGEGDFQAIFVPWFVQPEYRREVPAGFVLQAEEARYAQAFGLDLEQMAWRRFKLVDDFAGDVSLFDQEYPASPDMAFMRGADKGLATPLQFAEARKRKPMFDRGPKILGVDPAEYGSDKSAIVCRQGRKVHWIQTHSKVGTMQLAGLVAQHIDEIDPDGVCIDVTGVGTGVADRLIELGYDCIYRVHFGESAYDDEKYVNRGAECWALMAEWLRDKPNFLPDDDDLQAQVTARPYHYDSSRRLVLMSKERLREKGLPSPDKADALALTFAERITVRDKPTTWRSRLHTHTNSGASAQAA